MPEVSCHFAAGSQETEQFETHQSNHLETGLETKISRESRPGHPDDPGMDILAAQLLQVVLRKCPLPLRWTWLGGIAMQKGKWNDTHLVFSGPSPSL